MYILFQDGNSWCAVYGDFKMESHTFYDDKFQHCWIATIWDEERQVPEIYSGRGNTKEEALDIAKEKYKNRGG